MAFTNSITVHEFCPWEDPVSQTAIRRRCKGESLGEFMRRTHLALLEGALEKEEVVLFGLSFSIFIIGESSRFSHV